MSLRRGMRVALAIAALATLAAAWPERTARAQTSGGAEYRLGVGDEVQLSVLQQPALDRALTVRPDGTIVVPLVGEIAVVGMTPREAGDVVRQRLRLFNREIADVSLTVTQYNALRVSVLGAVTAPGAYTFPQSPNVWEALRAAGGPTAAANLAAVRVVRQEGTETRTEFHDLSGIMNGQEAVPPVPLRAGDSVVIPSREEAGLASGESAVQVLGSVARPGAFTLMQPTRLVSVLLLAGGPLETSHLGKIAWVHDEGGGRYRAARVDLGEFMTAGDLAGNPIIYPGDTVQVPFRGQGFFRSVWPVLLSTVTAATAIALATSR